MRKSSANANQRTSKTGYPEGLRDGWQGDFFQGQSGKPPHPVLQDAASLLRFVRSQVDRFLRNEFLLASADFFLQEHGYFLPV